MLATGGLGQIYTSTTNPPVATGDGMAAALRAGARVTDLEFVQFHPTVLFLGEGSTGQQPLISEAVRGEGAFLVDGAGVRIMAGRHELADLAPRDVVARAILDVMRDQHVDHVWLDARHLGADFLEQRFPSIVARCRELGFDPATELLPVAPAQHYASGGVETDLLGRSSVDGLYACGECSCTGVHGANRLASNSLLEGLVFAHRIADDVTSRFAAGELPLRAPASDAGDAAVLDASHRLDVQRAMTRGSGPVRSGRVDGRGARGARRPRRGAAEHGRTRARPPGRRPTCCTSGRPSRSWRTGARRPAAGTCAPTSPSATTRAGCCTSRRPGRPTGRSSSPSGRWRPPHDRPRIPRRPTPCSLVERALDEDLATGTDVTTMATIPASQQSVSHLVARADGVVAGPARRRTRAGCRGGPPRERRGGRRGGAWTTASGSRAVTTSRPCAGPPAPRSSPSAPS